MALNTKNLDELENLYQRNILIIDFILDKSNSDPMILHYKQIIKDAHKKGNLKGIRTLSRDVNAWAKGLSSQDREELEQILLNKIGEDLAGDKTTKASIELLLTRGKISNEEEFRIIDEYLKEILEGDLFWDRTSEMEKLLEEYEE